MNEGCEPHEFLNLLFGRLAKGCLEVTYLVPDGLNLHPRTVVQWRDMPLGDIDPAMPNVHALNQKGYSCYFAPVLRKARKNPEQRISKKTGKPFMMQPRGNEQDALCLVALWADVDGDTPDDLANLKNSIIPPSILVHSGGGYHAYWLLDNPLLITDDNRAMIKQTLKGIAKYHGCDTKVAELARIMRLPGTVNTKPSRNGALCQVVDIVLEGRYHYLDFELNYAPFAAPPIPLPTRNMNIPADKRIPRWVQNYLDVGEKEGGRNARLYAACRALLDNGFTSYEAVNMCIGRALADGLSETEANRTMESAVNAPRGSAHVDSHMQTRMGTADKRLQF